MSSLWCIVVIRLFEEVSYVLVKFSQSSRTSLDTFHCWTFIPRRLGGVSVCALYPHATLSMLGNSPVSIYSCMCCVGVYSVSRKRDSLDHVEAGKVAERVRVLFYWHASAAYPRKPPVCSHHNSSTITARSGAPTPTRSVRPVWHVREKCTRTHTNMCSCGTLKAQAA